MTSYDTWFRDVTGVSPYAWQASLAAETVNRDRILRVPTGFGKTAGTALAWLFHRCVRKDEAWPRRLVFCLPMRVLVEQTEQALLAWVKAAGLDVPVHVLIGGREAARWLDELDKPVILVGTQDMLLSRALNRGYASARALWPMELGALHSDALWVTDEVQLMDVGLATTTQLAAFRSADRAAGRPSFRPAVTWWMSATLQSSWLESVDFKSSVQTLPRTSIDRAERTEGLWKVSKSLEARRDVGTPDEVAKLVAEQHQAGELSLVIVNTVDRAKKVAAAFATAFKRNKAALPELKIVHSRFRSHERRGWNFLNRDANKPENLPDQGRIIVATQVVEAGVDISASLLVTDLAPWSSLVQRFGRCARYVGESGRVFVVSAPPAKESDARPYALLALVGSDQALAALMAGPKDVGPKTLEAFEEELAEREPAKLAELYPYEPANVLRRPDFDELFDTSADLSGADLDVGRYIRSGEDRDVSAFWRVIEGKPGTLRDMPWPARDELCPVPVGEMRTFLDKEKKDGFILDFIKNEWRKLRPGDKVVPGMTVLLPSTVGGYTEASGWDGGTKSAVAPVNVQAPQARDRMIEASLANDDDALALADGYKTIRLHGHETALEVERIAMSFGLPTRLAELLCLAARWHDAGKAHPVFQAAISGVARAANVPFGSRSDLAKAPGSAFRRPPYPERPGFRHELASTLLLFEVLRRRNPDHPALLGPHRELFALLGENVPDLAATERLEGHPLAEELNSLDGRELDLVAYLVCAHHGKVRGRLASTPQDMEAGMGAIHGIVDETSVSGRADEIPSFALAGHSGSGEAVELPALPMSLSLSAMGVGTRYGASWTDRCQRLLEAYGPFSLAFLETVLRLADWRASALPSEVSP
jgi:CRISPR-associated endonuclease/helicase Cas3